MHKDMSMCECRQALFLFLMSGGTDGSGQEIAGSELRSLAHLMHYALPRNVYGRGSKEEKKPVKLGDHISFKRANGAVAFGCVLRISGSELQLISVRLYKKATVDETARVGVALVQDLVVMVKPTDEQISVERSLVSKALLQPFGDSLFLVAPYFRESSGLW
eukprot:TRINITY_DN11031_c1_g1_i2.p1 TRINITY_DN11031_c1_g1~~TRINITY_DN11031_c1_g1_i2.p1  ORF type:complete len:162 (+),score=7.56 TRINITY_DN11031_c1_g1_i2:241-726(+)